MASDGCVDFTIDGQPVSAAAGETILTAARRRARSITAVTGK